MIHPRCTATVLALVALAGGCRTDYVAVPVPAPAADGFPVLGDIPADRLVAAADAVTAAPEGHFAVAGRPRFLIGAQILPAYITGLKPTSGYKAELAWLYEKPLDRVSARRLGLDSLGYFTGDGWLDAIIPEQGNRFLCSPQELAGLGAMLRDVQLPVYIDFTCFPWTHGSLNSAKARQTSRVPEAALNAGGFTGNTNHWVPYSATTPEGRGLYTAMWRHGTAEAQARGVRPLVYELFNEPAYDDPSPANRALFQQRLGARYADIAALNLAWGSAYADFAAVAAFQRPNEQPGLQVAWGLFMEDAFVDLCRLGRATVRSLDPAAPCAVQPMGMDLYRALGKSNVNIYRLAAEMDVVGTGTGGGISVSEGLAAPLTAVIDTPDCDNRVVEGFLHLRFIRAVAGAKPIYDGEAYAGSGARSAEQLAGRLWLELARGCGATWLFACERRTWDPLWKGGGEVGGRRLADKFPWDLLNPYATKPEVLTGIHAFKRAMAPVEGLMTERRNRLPANVGLLLSLPSERIAPAVATATHQQIRTYANALEFSHQAYDIVLEEQLDERAGRYRAIVAAGIRTAYAGTPAALRRYVAAGGTLILGLEALEADEFGRPRGADDLLGPPLGAPLPPRIGTLAGTLASPAWLPGSVRGQPWRAITATAGWTVLATVGDQPVVLERRLGQGRIIYAGLRLPAYPLAALLGGLLAGAGVERLCDLRSAPDGQLAPNVEVHRFAANGVLATFLFNWDRYPKLATIDLPPGHGAIDALGRRGLPVAAGRALLVLPPMAPAMLLSGSAGAVDELVGPCPLADRGTLAAEVAGWQPPADRGPAGLGPAYPAAGRTYATLDLRTQANRAFVDQVAGDGAGGWTDQGAANSLEGTPWGRQELLGVPFEFIRCDENADRTCLALRSTHLPGGAPRLDGIQVGRPMAALHLLQAAAWCDGQDGKEVLRYVVHYADGSTVEVPVRHGREIADWWDTKPVVGQARRAWFNSEQRSLFAWRWENPHPERLVTTIDVVSAEGPAVGILVAATAEFADDRRLALPLQAWRAQPWLGAESTLVGGVLKLVLPAEALDWCGVEVATADPAAGVAPPEGGWPLAGSLVLEINSLPDSWGAAQGGQALQAALVFRSAAGRRSDGPFAGLAVNDGIDRDPATWQTATAALAALVAGHSGETVIGLRLQFLGSRPLAGVELRSPALTGH